MPSINQFSGRVSVPAVPRLYRFLLGLLILSYATAGCAKPQEYSEQVWNAAGVDIRVYTFRPSSCDSHDILFVFHGLNRKAEGVRNKATKVAQKICLMVFAPLFDKDRFPNWRYHRAGVIRGDRIQPMSRWTEPILRAMLHQAKSEIGRTNPRVYLFGHSAGGQFLSRVSAYSLPFEVDRIVVANPSVHVTPDSSEKVPYGFGGLFDGEESEARIRQYLALPISIYLGQKDTRNKNLVVNEAANRQGTNRLQRGRNVFRRAQQLADERDWKFNWLLVEASGVGHSSRGMLQAPEMITALGRDENESRD